MVVERQEQARALLQTPLDSILAICIFIGKSFILLLRRQKKRRVLPWLCGERGDGESREEGAGMRQGLPRLASLPSIRQS